MLANNNIHGAARYSEMVQRNCEKIIVRPTEEQNCEKTRKEIQERIEPEKLAISVNNIKYVKNGGILISCSDINSKDKIKNKMEELKDKYVIEEPLMKKPTIIIVNAEEDYINKENDEIVKCLVEQNNMLNGENELKLKVVRKYIIKNKKNCGNIIVEMENDIYKKALLNGTINLGWRRCKIFEHVNVIRCFKCARYGHVAKNCQNKLACIKCAGNHNSKDCEE